jgi:prepilin-type N-terminal cleavage/methylation domain-containing protein
MEDRMSSAIRNQSGFSMIELLVALSILITGTLAVATMLIRSSETTAFSNRERSGDAIALELVEAVKAEAATTTFSEMENLRLEKLVPGSSTKYEYRDDTTSTKGSVGISGNYVQRLGVGQNFIYKWRVEDRQQEYQLPSGMLKLEVIVGWSNCTGADPDTCARRTKITNWIIEAKN